MNHLSFSFSPQNRFAFSHDWKLKPKRNPSRTFLPTQGPSPPSLTGLPRGSFGKNSRKSAPFISCLLALQFRDPILSLSYLIFKQHQM